jgi:hypothetical protein
LEGFGANPTDSSVGGYWDCYLVTVILVVWFVYLKIINNWQHNQLSNGAAGLNAKIRKELAENEDGTVWSERKVKLANCVAQKRRE